MKLELVPSEVSPHSVQWWCLHGALGSYRDWQRVPLPGSTHAVNLWGTCRGINLWDWARKWTASVRDEVEGKGDVRPCLLGYSMGGRLALHALLVAPDLWSAAIIVSAHPGLEAETDRRQRREKDAAWLARFEEEPFDEVIADWNAQPVFASATGSPVDFAPKALLPGMERAFGEWSLGSQDSLWSQLGEIKVPLWWLCGSQDAKFVELGKRAASLLPGGRYQEASGCHHRVPWEWSEMSAYVRSVSQLVV